MSVEELVNALRDWKTLQGKTWPFARKAADKLEELDAYRRKVIAENERLLYALIEANRKLEELSAALRVAQGNTDAAIEDYNEAKAALAEKDKEIAALKYQNEVQRDLINELRNAGGKDG